ncbi:MAG: SDR family NAD(P)-dependent oxidoreductase [Emcibacteraceae bacterium]|nr:SDR family NAD(P)-dependent oxidoreductase [Emcibacteraceae bacterium]MDG1857596.1 SDR family NAD(P)-dependent oxidoreductase [Emcibacteraceae bacterium]
MNKLWKSAWVIGGSTGLGAELVRELTAAGINTYVSARNEERLNELCDKFTAAKPYPLDITNEAACVRAVADINKLKNSLPDLIILNAAVYSPMDVESFDAAEIANMIDVNYMGVVNMLAALLPFRKFGKRVTIAAVTSPSGWRGLPGAIGYGPSKAAVINMMESMKPELDGHGFDLRVANPGFIKTRLTDKNSFEMPQLMSANDAATRTLKGLSTKKFDISFPNPFLSYLKLLRILPYGLFFRIMKRINQKKEAL